jgi:hypothetical protein
VTSAAGREEAVPGHSGATLSEEEELVIHYRLARTSFVTVVRVRPGGVAEVLGQPARMSGGRHDLSVNDARARVSLRGAKGPNRFAIFATAAPLSAEALRSALEALGRGVAPPGPGSAVAIDWFDVVVEK